MEHNYSNAKTLAQSRRATTTESLALASLKTALENVQFSKNETDERRKKYIQKAIEQTQAALKALQEMKV